jgi:S-adenosylmethionine decarboxylase
MRHASPNTLESSGTQMNVGVEWLIDAEGCAAEALRDEQVIRRLCDEIIRDLDLHVLGQPVWHKFPPPSGVTGLFLLTESHLACHTYPESGLATFNLYCCKPRREWPWEERLKETLGAQRVTVRREIRGTGLIGEEETERQFPIETIEHEVMR